MKKGKLGCGGAVVLLICIGVVVAVVKFLIQHIFTFMFLLCLALLIVGLFRPGAVVRWGKKRSRWQAAMIYGASSFVFLVIAAVHASTSQPAGSGLQPLASGDHKVASTTYQAAGSSASGNGAGAAAKASASATSNSSTAGNSSLVPVVVARDIDGDTIHVTMPDGHDETIRMLLIDTPEDVDPRKPVEPYSLQAAAFAKRELPVGKHIEIEEGKPGYTRDKYGRLLAFVYVTPSDMYNEDVVKQGFARVAYIYPPNTQHLASLQADQQYAMARKLGIWSIPGYVTPNGYNIHVGNFSGSSSQTVTAPTSTQTSAARGVSVVSSNLSVSDGDEASVTIHTSPGSRGTIAVDYKSGPSHAQGLSPQTADSRGDITWQWKVGTHTTHGDWPVIISVGGKTIRLTLHVG